MIKSLLKIIIFVILVFFVGSSYAHYELGWGGGGKALIVISWIVGFLLLGALGDYARDARKNN